VDEYISCDDEIKTRHSVFLNESNGNSETSRESREGRNRREKLIQKLVLVFGHFWRPFFSPGFYFAWLSHAFSCPPTDSRCKINMLGMDFLAKAGFLLPFLNFEEFVTEVGRFF
jgi:hypothetical protein